MGMRMLSIDNIYYHQYRIQEELLKITVVGTWKFLSRSFGFLGYEAREKKQNKNNTEN